MISEIPDSLQEDIILKCHDESFQMNNFGLVVIIKNILCFGNNVTCPHLETYLTPLKTAKKDISLS